MSWIGPLARGGKTLVRFGPQAKIAGDLVGKDAVGAASTVARRQADRRRAFRKAATVTSGAVLQLVESGEPVWVVLSSGEPVDCYPPTTAPLAELMRVADRSRAVSWRDHESARLRNRVRRRRSGGAAGPDADCGDDGGPLAT